MTIKQLKEAIEIIDPNELEENIDIEFIFNTKTGKGVKTGKVTGLLFGITSLTLVASEELSRGGW